MKNFGLGKSRSFGFIYAATDGIEIFVHRDNLSGDLSNLSEGQKVIFKLQKDAKGKSIAVNVRLDR